MWEIPRSQATLLVQGTTMTGYCLEILCSKMVIDFRCLRVFLFLAPKNLRNFTARKQTKKKDIFVDPRNHAGGTPREQPSLTPQRPPKGPKGQ